MKVVKKRFSGTLPALHLDRRDVDTMVHIAAEWAFSIEVNGIEYEGLEEFYDKLGGKAITTYQIDLNAPKGSYGSVALRSKPHEVWISCTGDGDLIASRIAHELRSGTRWFSYSSSTAAWFTLEFLATLVLWGAVIFAVPSGWSGSFAAVAVIIGSYLLGKANLVTGSLYVGYREDQSTFWRRNQDKIVLMIASALVGAAITAAVQKLF